MKFKDFLTELALPSPPMGMDNVVCDTVNKQFKTQLNDVILSPQIGFLKIRGVLRNFGYELPALYAVEAEGDEVVLDVIGTDLLLYVLYYQTDDGNYEFYAELNDVDGIEDIISKDEELEKE